MPWRRVAYGGAMRVASSRVQVTTRPHVGAPLIGGGNAAFPLNRPVTAFGDVTLVPHPGESAVGWTVGFLQAQWIETNWAVYRGPTQGDGSTFVQRARPPARPRQACSDCLNAGAPFYGSGSVVPQPAGPGGGLLPMVVNLGAGPTPLSATVGHYDQPSDSYPLSCINTTTNANNALQMVQLEFAFCTVLAVRDPAGKAILLGGFYWNVNWQYEFTPNATTTVAKVVPKGTHSNVGAVFTGAPDDRRFSSIFTATSPTTCNAVAQTASTSPNLKMVKGWPLFDVTR